MRRLFAIAGAPLLLAASAGSLDVTQQCNLLRFNGLQPRPKSSTEL